MKFKWLIPTAFLIFGCSACDDNKNDEPAVEVYPEQGNVTSHDGLEWFENSIIILDGDGNFKDYLVGKVLDEATPGIVSLCVDSEDEASDIFMSWIAPDAESNVVAGNDGKYVYTPVSETGLPQGTITYTPNPENGDLAKVTFSDNIVIPNLREIRFIADAKWPDNDFSSSQYQVGDVVSFDTEVGRQDKNCSLEGTQKGVCIRESSKSQKGLILYISDKTFFIKGNRWYNENMVSKSLGTEIHNILSDNWNTFVGYFKDAGRTLRDNEYYWLSDRKDVAVYIDRKGMNLKTGKVDWFDTLWKRPEWKKPYMLCRTF